MRSNHWWTRIDFWVYGDEVLAPLPPDERKRIRRLIGKKIFRHPMRWFILLFVLAGWDVWAGHVAVEFLYPFRSFGMKLLALLGLLAFGLGMFILQWHNRRLRRRELKRMMLAGEIHLNYCLDCHYDLRGTDDETCPECGCRIAAPKQP